MNNKMRLNGLYEIFLKKVEVLLQLFTLIFLKKSECGFEGRSVKKA